MQWVLVKKYMAQLVLSSHSLNFSSYINANPSPSPFSPSLHKSRSARYLGPRRRHRSALYPTQFNCRTSLLISRRRSNNTSSQKDMGQTSLAPEGALVSQKHMTFEEPYLASSPARSQDYRSNSDVDSATGARRSRIASRSRFRSRFRSKNGCLICRQRKVKCDEEQPRCGSCTRLDKKCVWTQKREFVDCRVHTQCRNKHVSTAGSLSWQGRSHQNRSTRQPDIENIHLLPPFTELSDEDKREQRTMTRPLGTFNVILTPDSFTRLPKYGDITKGDRGFSRRSSSATTEPEESDLVILAELEDSPYCATLPNMESRTISTVDQFLYAPLAQRAITHYGLGDVETLLVHWRHFVSRRLMPMASAMTLFDIGGQECPMIRESRIFQPVRNMHR